MSMSPDLIKRAAERLVRERETSLVERAAQKLGASGTALPAETALPDAPAYPAAGPAAGAAPEVGLPPRRRQTSVTIDMSHLRAKGFITPDGEATRIAEEFRVIKRPLLTAAFGGSEQSAAEPPVKNGHLLMVTSAKPNEGKTFVALNLAMSLASERHLNVLLVDADFKNPSVPRQLGFQAQKGLIDVLAERDLDLADVMLRTNVRNLTILPAGFEQANATELLASQEMAALIREIADRYNDRIIIFDSPPVLASSEPGVLAMHVGQVVFVVEAGATNRRAVQEALGLLNACPQISLVLNKRPPLLGADQFGTYYGYGAGREGR